jgi:hypothetical protein
MGESLTDEQDAQLSEVLTVLSKLQTPALIFEAARLRLTDPPWSPQDKTRLRRAYGGVVAASKIQSYLESMRQANLRRLRVGQTIQKLNEEVRARRATDPLSVVLPAIEIPALSGLQEVEVHTFVIAVHALYELLPIAARAAGHTIKRSVLKSLRLYIDLRDFYEHPDQRLPGAVHEHMLQAFAETDNEEGFRMMFGLLTDPETGEFVLDGQTVDVSSRAVLAVQRIAEDAWAGIKQSVLADMVKYFRRNPERIPDPQSVVSDFQIRVGGLLEQVPLIHEMDRELFEEVRGVLVPVRLPVYDFS